MSNVSTKTKITTAVSKFSEFNLDSQHITTSNFMELNVAKCVEMVPNQSISIDHKVFARLEPMVVPTFGSARIHKRCFFVPYRTVFPAWNDFITDTVHSFSDGSFPDMIQSVPTISNSLFLSLFTNSSYSINVTSTATAETCDFVLVNGGNTLYYNFTPFGRWAYKLIRSLGYQIEFNWKNKVQLYSALPLFALCRIYLDWYYPSQYAFDNLAMSVEQWLKYDGRTFSTTFTSSDLGDIFSMLHKVCYDDNPFVLAWDNPMMPSNTFSSDISISDISKNGEVSSSTVSSTDTEAQPYLSTNGTVSQFMLNALRSLTSYMQRHKIVGARALDRYLSRWGIRLAAEKLNRCILIGSQSQDIDFGDVVSTSDTDGASLGTYAGRGLSSGDAAFEFKSDEFGMLFILTSIVPRTSLYQGIDRTVLHKSRLDFFTPEFDNLGVQAVGSREVYLPMDGQFVGGENGVDTNNFVFGFLPRYAEYKYARDVLSGDYILGSKNTGKDSWTLYRNLKPLFSSSASPSTGGMNAVVHDFDFVVGSDSDQYDRIFQNTENNADKFNVINIFYIRTKFPGRSLWDSYEFENEDTANKVTVDVGGSKMN